MDNGESEMNPVAMTVIRHLTDYWASRRFEPTTCCSQVLYATGTRLDDGEKNSNHERCTLVTLGLLSSTIYALVREANKFV